ncbi:MAG: SMI1/KNR4 family protein [Saprospiraceae bacterium]|nr:SMI1/KNR4 family protein [Saprospiraceae bacterium]MBK6668067.1 SMI1/KNR4 family protein [Saprospiraceae bacterium]MBK8828611.1 SMI1/KNR4 family protein [Saprospiraceae bacterium]HQV66575.1 SMI1/KNR4 family protein [Saprospiraceae bacterium]
MKELNIAPRAGKRYIQLLENAIGSSLPGSLRSIITKYAGLSVLENTYLDSNNTEWELQTFDHIASMVDLTKEFIEKGWGKKIPFAYDPGGWHFCLSFDEDTFGKVVVNRWSDHLPEDQFIVIADSFEEFINGLTARPNHLL